MHCVLYKFIVKEGQTENLFESWLDLTKLIYNYEGSLGSRLHKVSELEYIAYAQWPNKDFFDNAGDNIPDTEADPIRQRMKASCKIIETLYEMEMIEDYLQTKPSNE